MNSIIIFGGSGQLGKSLSSVFPDAFLYHHLSPERNADITNPERLGEIFESQKPDVVINAAAFTNVDACESDKGRAFAVNSLGVRNIAWLCREYSSKLIHLSTDYVFNGETGSYTEESIPNPINYYGFSKAMGDAYALSLKASLVIRTSGVFGFGNNFPRLVYDNLVMGKTVNVIDGYYSPITSDLLALAIRYLVDHSPDLSGILNIAGERISRFDFARSIAKTFDLNLELIFKVKNLANMTALRPSDSSLEISKAKKIVAFNFYSKEANMKSFKKMMGSL